VSVNSSMTVKTRSRKSCTAGKRQRIGRGKDGRRQWVGERLQPVLAFPSDRQGLPASCQNADCEGIP
jgi:hypothetical protein